MTFRPQAIGPAACAAVGVFCLTRGALAMPAGALGSLLPATLVALALALGLVALISRADRAQRTHRYRIDPGGAPSAAIDHEVAHADKGDQFGGHCVAGRVFSDGSGWVDVRLPRAAPLAHHVAVDMAGARGEGANFWTSPHARGDRANAAARLAHLPDDEREQVYREAARLAGPRWWVSGSAGALRRALHRTGRYR